MSTKLRARLEQQRQVPQQLLAPHMDPELQRGWDDWVRAHIRIALADNFRTVLRPAIGQAMSTYVSERLEREAGKLREELASEIASLRADITVQVRTAKSEIARLHGSVPIKRQRDGTR